MAEEGDMEQLALAGAFLREDLQALVWQASVRRGLHSVRDVQPHLRWWDQHRTDAQMASVPHRASDRTYTIAIERFRPDIDLDAGIVGDVPFVQLGRTDRPKIVASQTAVSTLASLHVIVIAGNEEEMPWRVADALPAVGGREPRICLQPHGVDVWVGLFDLASA